MKINTLIFSAIFTPWILLSGYAHGQALPANKTGSAISQGITQTLIKRGFAANDPRIAQTINAISSRTSTIAAAAGGSGSMLSIVARLSPYITAGVLIYAGVTWYFDSTGKVTLQPPVSNNQPIFSNGLQTGQLAWTIQGGYWGSPQEAISYVFSNTIAIYPTAIYSNVNVVYTNSNNANVSYHAKISSLGVDGDYTKTATAIIWNGINCPAGYGYSGSGSSCTSAGLNNPNNGLSGSQIQSFTPQQAFDNLSTPAKSAPLSPELASETANRLWRNAAAQPGYPGVPWSNTVPTTPQDFLPWQTAQPTFWPTTNDWGSAPLPNSNPIPAPDSNSNSIPSAPSGSTTVNLGTDPGSPPPTLEDPPADLFKPIKDLLQPWLSWSVPSHVGTCPTWQAAPSIAGYVFHIDLKFHCSFIEQFRNLIFSIAMLCWILIAAFIILTA
jgi:hypothetical protein